MMRRLRLTAALLLWLAPSLAAAATHTYKTGETLAKIAETYYGHRHYQLVIAKLNQIKDPAKIPDGTNLRVPDLKEMLLTEGFPRDLGPELDQIVKARYGFLRVHEELTRALHPGNSTGKVQVPAAVRSELHRDADSFDKAGKVLAKQGNFSDSATRMRQRLNRCGVVLRQLADGATDKDLEDEVHLRLAQTFVRGLMWAHHEDEGL